VKKLSALGTKVNKYDTVCWPF